MITGATGDDVHCPGLAEYFVRLVAECLCQQMAAGNPFGQRVGHSFGLLVDLLEHEVAVPSFVHGVCAELALFHWPVRFFSFAVEHLYRRAGNFGDITILEKYKAPCNRQQRGHVGSHIVFIVPQTEHDRRAATGSNQSVGKLAADDDQGVGANQFGYSCANCG